ncbi:MAG: phage portal protein, partial [Sneathiella sp.]
ARMIGISTAAEDRVRTLARNGFKPTGVLMLDKILKDEQREQIRGQFNDLAEGAGDPLKVLEAGMKYQQISMNPRDVQLLETRRFSLEDLARIFGVPSVLINDTSGSTVWGSGISEIKEGFYTLGLQPTLERMEAGMKKWLLKPEERAKYDIEFDFSTFLRGNEKQRAENAAIRINSGQSTINEERKERGLPPVEGGDTPYLQKQMIPLNELEKGQQDGFRN